MRVPIAYAINDGYTKILTALLIPMFEQAKAETVYDLYILNYNLPKQSKELITSSVLKLDQRSVVTFLDISDENYKQLKNCNAGWGVESNYRGFLAEFISNIDKILYLDADTMVLEDLSHLMEIPLSGYIFGASKDVLAQNRKLSMIAQADNDFRSGKLTEVFDYVNAGVLLINLAYWREFNIGQEYLRLLLLGAKAEHRVKGSNFSAFSDQDVLNYLAIREGINRIYYLPVTYNSAFCYPSIPSPENNDVSKFLCIINNFEDFKIQNEVFRRNRMVFDQKLITDRIQIIHFCSHNKPWDSSRDPLDAHVELFKTYADRVHLSLPPLGKPLNPLVKGIRIILTSLQFRNFFKQHVKYKLLAAVMFLFGFLFSFFVIYIF